MRSIRLLLLMFLALAAAGCGGPVTSMVVEVRDLETQAPIAGAVVRVRPLYFSILVELNPFTEGATSARTDEAGRARLTAPRDTRAQVMVFPPDRPPDTIIIDEHPADTGPTKWIDPRGPEDPSRRFEVRLLPSEPE